MEEEFSKDEIVEPKKEEKREEPKKHLSWDNKFNIGHILTFFAIIIAAIGLIFQKKDLDSKIDDLNKVVQKLEEEKLERELQDIYGNTEMYNYFNYSHGYTIDRITEIGIIYDSEFLFLLSEINDILDLLVNKEKLSERERRNLELLKNRNALKSFIFLQGMDYRHKVTQFIEDNSPQKENYINSDEYIKEMGTYTKKLEFHVDSLKLISDSLISKVIIELKKVEGEYINK